MVSYVNKDRTDKCRSQKCFKCQGQNCHQLDTWSEICRTLRDTFNLAQSVKEIHRQSTTKHRCVKLDQQLTVQYTCSVQVIRVTTLQTLKFPDNSLMIRGTLDHFNWYSYHACTSVKVNDQTVNFIFNNNDFIMITS